MVPSTRSLCLDSGLPQNTARAAPMPLSHHHASLPCGAPDCFRERREARQIRSLRASVKVLCRRLEREHCDIGLHFVCWACSVASGYCGRVACLVCLSGCFAVTDLCCALSCVYFSLALLCSIDRTLYFRPHCFVHSFTCSLPRFAALFGLFVFDHDSFKHVLVWYCLACFFASFACFACFVVSQCLSDSLSRISLLGSGLF